MHREALGFIETLGMIPAVEAADSCVKSANVKFLGYERSTGGLITIKIEGDVGAVKAAIEAGKASAQKLGIVISTLIIPRPANGIECMVTNNKNNNIKDKCDEEINSIEKDEDDAKDEKNEKDEKDEKQKDTDEVKDEVIKSEEISDSENKDIDNSEIKKKRNVCNLCYDPKCTRKKGQPKTLCIHNKSK